ncbi:lysophospholipid acyltransferase family protein [Mangrovibrevibacter kandeliae]|uniref:lysophospholipid acyltransferase family protein n=1 Tax=Mangrovibrevibacter kandeliae TaxID=2968473 RepID=UPI002118D229|nr:lysophospholipid acyltransferase family protein [Aurantimonas sp. CSK15Z-1]MCQ8782173.1 1-acyl-sn-glycerol-3-phosphate acyltransferase [Aurantimonas sp. CSK15Z-1]
MIAWLRVGLIASTLTLMTLVQMPLQNLAIARKWRLARRLPFLWHRIACRLIGIRVTLNGRPATERPLLIVANHQSWADITVLGRVTELSFIAKAEVRSWPAFGTLARLQRTVFVERGERHRTGEQADAIAERLVEGDAMVLFAEGTTSDGNEVLPFKTALFGAAQAALRQAGGAVLVQPVAVAYRGAHGLPLGRYGRPLAAWPGDVPLLPHLLAFLREGAIDVEVSFGTPIPFDAGGDRKRLARQVESEVRRMLAASLRGPNCHGRLQSVASPDDSALARATGQSDIGSETERSFQKGA